MASLVVAGDSSGSVTLAAPAVAGTTTLTLPTSSGTLVVTGGAQTVQFAAGSAAAPSITFTGDTNTGIFSPAADTIAFTEGGVESMRIDSSGNLGIGTNNPSSYGGGAKLAVQGSGTLQTWFVGGSSSGGYAFFSNNAQTATTNAFQIGQGWNTGSDNISFLNAGGANPLMFATNSTERMRIDSSGRLLVGTTSALSNSLATFGNTTGSVVGWGLATLQNAGGITPPTSIGMSFGWNYSNGGGENNIVFGTTAGSTPALAFSSFNGTTVTERMRITSGGSILMGTTANPTSALLTGTGSLMWAGSNVNNTAGNEFFFINGGDRYIVNHGTSLSGSSVHFYFLNPNGIVGNINTNGSSTVYATSSDYRLKENIAPMMGALAKVSALKPVTYKWKVDGSNGEGFIAHELAEVVPNAVTGEKDAVDEEGKPVYQGVDTSFLVATLTAAIQEQQQIINDLKARIETLEGAK